jgi:hypothetical protein
LTVFRNAHFRTIRNDWRFTCNRPISGPSIMDLKRIQLGQGWRRCRVLRRIII